MASPETTPPCIALRQVPREPRGGSADLGEGNSRGKGSLGGMRNGKSVKKKKMNELNRDLIVKLRERKGWDLSPGNYLKIKKKKK